MAAYVIVIDDDPTVPKIVESSIGIQCLHFRNPRKLLSDSRTFNPLCVFLDLHLDDGLMGLDFVKQIRQKYPTAAIISITADDDPELLTAAMALGVDDHINKPLDPFELKARFLRRVKPLARNGDGQKVTQFGVVFDFQALEMKGEKGVAYLSRREMSLAELLVKSPQVGETQIASEIWGKVSVPKNSIQKLVSELRKKLSDVSDLIEIKYRKNEGYSFEQLGCEMKNVLIVENHELSLSVHKAVFSQLKFKVFAASRLGDALIHAADNDIDLAIIETGHGFEDGIDLPEILAKKSLNSEVKCVALANVQNDDEKIELMKKGFLGVLGKPASVDKVKAFLNEVGLAESSHGESTGASENDIQLVENRVLEELSTLPEQDGEPFLSYMLSLFKQSLKETWPQIFEDNDGEKISKMAHKLKGASLNIGASELGKQFSLLQYDPNLKNNDDFVLNLKSLRKKSIAEIENYLTSR